MHGWEQAVIIFAWAREGQIRPKLEISEQSQVRLGPFTEGAWPGVGGHVLIYQKPGCWRKYTRNASTRMHTQKCLLFVFSLNSVTAPLY